MYAESNASNTSTRSVISKDATPLFPKMHLNQGSVGTTSIALMGFPQVLPNEKFIWFQEPLKAVRRLHVPSLVTILLKGIASQPKTRMLALYSRLGNTVLHLSREVQ